MKRLKAARIYTYPSEYPMGPNQTEAEIGKLGRFAREVQPVFPEKEAEE